MAKKGIWSHTIVRRITYITVLIAVWYGVYAMKLFPEILFPSPFTVLETLFSELADGSLVTKTGYSLYLIVIGILISIALAFVLTVLAMTVPTVKDIVMTLVTVMDPLPGIALLPLAILWIGIGEKSIIFIMIHSVLWPMLLNVINGFDSVPKIYKDIGQNIGLSKFGIISGVYVPAAFPSILTGLKTGWARAWRALISAEMVFGATGLVGGLGWDIYVKRSYLNMAGMFSTLLVIMLIGILVEDMLFKKIEKATVGKWGMRA